MGEINNEVIDRLKELRELGKTKVKKASKVVSDFTSNGYQNFKEFNRERRLENKLAALDRQKEQLRNETLKARKNNTLTELASTPVFFAPEEVTNDAVEAGRSTGSGTGAMNKLNNVSSVDLLTTGSGATLVTPKGGIKKLEGGAIQIGSGENEATFETPAKYLESLLSNEKLLDKLDYSKVGEYEKAWLQIDVGAEELISIPILKKGRFVIPPVWVDSHTRFAYLSEYKEIFEKNTEIFGEFNNLRPNEQENLLKDALQAFSEEF